jgi:hypothetical protein
MVLDKELEPPTAESGRAADVAEMGRERLENAFVTQASIVRNTSVERNLCDLSADAGRLFDLETIVDGIDDRSVEFNDCGALGTKPVKNAEAGSGPKCGEFV